MVQKVKLNDGNEIPAVGLGTWQAPPGEVENAVKLAIDIGYRHFDCAYLYGNEKEIGEAIRQKIKEGVVKREDLFITSKLWNTFHRPETVLDACKKSLSNFGLDYLDLYLLHWPVAFVEGDDLFPKDAEGNFKTVDIDYVDTYLAMEECVKQKLTKSIGVSNFNHEQLDRLLSKVNIKPVMNQVQNGAVPIPKSTNPDRLKQNISIFDFEISAADMKTIDSLNINGRTVPFSAAKHDKYFPFNLEY